MSLNTNNDLIRILIQKKMNRLQSSDPFQHITLLWDNTSYRIILFIIKPTKFDSL
jgi:hypothetical protein